MNMNYYVTYIKNDLTRFGLLDTELSDDAWTHIVEAAMQEVLRYYDQTAFIEVPGQSCVDLKELEENNNIKISSVWNVYRNFTMGSSNSDYDVIADPAWIGFWQTGYGTRVTQWAYNYSNYINMQRIRNTVNGADLDWREDKIGRKLYVNFTDSAPTTMAIEYVPVIEQVDQIVGEYWVDILKRLALAYAKIAVGRARTRFVQSGALWTDDGANILQEGTTELTALRERLQVNAQFLYPVD